MEQRLRPYRMMSRTMGKWRSNMSYLALSCSFLILAPRHMDRSLRH